MTRRVHLASVTGAVIAPNGETAALLQTSPARIGWLALPSGREVGATPLPQAPVEAVFSADGSTLVTSYADCAFVSGPCQHGSDVSVMSVGASRAATVPVGPGAGRLAPVPGTTDVLVAASGAGSVSVVDVEGGPRPSSADSTSASGGPPWRAWPRPRTAAWPRCRTLRRALSPCCTWRPASWAQAARCRAPQDRCASARTDRPCGSGYGR